jgi:hypothetical protein
VGAIADTVALQSATDMPIMKPDFRADFRRLG